MNPGGLTLPSAGPFKAGRRSPSPGSPPPGPCQISSVLHLVPVLSRLQHLDPQPSWVSARSSLASGWWCVWEHRLMTFNCFVCSAGLTATALSALRVREKSRAPTSVLPALSSTASAAGLRKPILETVPAPSAPSPALGWHPQLGQGLRGSPGSHARLPTTALPLVGRRAGVSCVSPCGSHHSARYTFVGCPEALLPSTAARKGNEHTLGGAALGLALCWGCGDTEEVLRESSGSRWTSGPSPYPRKYKSLNGVGGWMR